jgi:hypothetical protein
VPPGRRDAGHTLKAATGCAGRGSDLLEPAEAEPGLVRGNSEGLRGQGRHRPAQDSSFWGPAHVSVGSQRAAMRGLRYAGALYLLDSNRGKFTLPKKSAPRRKSVSANATTLSVPAGTTEPRPIPRRLSEEFRLREVVGHLATLLRAPVLAASASSLRTSRPRAERLPPPADQRGAAVHWPSKTRSQHQRPERPRVVPRNYLFLVL